MTTAVRRFRVWCLSWDETEDEGCDVEAYDILGEYPRGRRNLIQAPDTVLHDASDAAEVYADFVHDQRDGYECTWPLVFRVCSADGTIADFEVDRDYVTTFKASLVKPKVPKAPETSEAIVKEGAA